MRHGHLDRKHTHNHKSPDFIFNVLFMTRKTVDLLKDPPRTLIAIDNNCAHNTNRLLIVLSIHHHFDLKHTMIVIMDQP